MDQEISLREIRLTEVTQEPDRNGFDLAKQVRLVPKFVEANIHEYFPHFEITATNMKWSRESWAMLSQEKHKKHTPHCQQKTVQIPTQSTRLLQSFELIPDAYRQKFRTQRKNKKQSFMEFVKEKERLMKQVVCYKIDRR